ncbi:5-(carboxyamino)imidazole ribonucleotide synthase [Jonesia quinghaiensis]|uniref:5-(carboxyamino)imidazole ribonucleotide synthase n=1 Tax=Jonesia quinghaiensis TaxID=262806 RepID=UPI0003F9B2D6|nr:5-(carboxyamino)imidazole ribonucleotide synthase [Jonesia quinghaiensis]
MAVISVIGGGQLARMMVPPASEIGVTLKVLVEAPGSSAAQVVVDAPVGAATDSAAVRALVAGSDVLTFEHEHVPHDMLRELIAEGVSVQPSPDALAFAQDKITMRTRLSQAGLPCPPWVAVPRDPAQASDVISQFIAEHGPQVIAKTARGGYDGKGVRVIEAATDIAEWIDLAQGDGPQLLLEQKVPFTRELAALVARTPSGEIAVWPVVESIQRAGVCSEVIAPAPGLRAEDQARIAQYATTIATDLGVTGVLAVELFEVAPKPGDDHPQIFINELAMRPHNSGHWTITGSVTSQFEQHLRAVADLPLGSTHTTAPWTVMANVLGSSLQDLNDALPHVLKRYPDAKVNLYGKEVRPGRKLGHVNISGSELDDVLTRAREAAALLRGEEI